VSLPFIKKKRPYIILKWAQTPNGFFAPNNQEQFWITSKRTKALVHSWRAQEMAILVGENTILADNPRLNVRLVAGKNPVRILINFDKKLPENLHVFDQSIPTLVFNKEKNEEHKNLHFVQLDTKADVLTQIIEYLYKHNIQSLMVEGGAYTLAQFIETNLWDEARILEGNKELHKGIKAPKIIGKIQEKYTIENDTITIIKNDLLIT
ncbi:MAG: RibD family protein, partial [Chitinophagales bacterium]|nr:RibD family protein [Chitinophagales bacterium]